MKIGAITLGVGILALAGYVINSREDTARPPEPKADPIQSLPSKPSTDLETYLREGFGLSGYETTWYKSITGVRIDGSTAIAEVRSLADAPRICNAVSGYVYDQTRRHELNSVRIEDSNSRVLINRRSIRDPCALTH